jgi:hypothetical protein
MKRGFFHNEDLIYGRVDMNFVHNIFDVLWEKQKLQKPFKDNYECVM